MSDYKCGECGADQFSCDCWELEAGKCRPQDIAGQIRLDELRDEHYGIGGSSR